MQTLKRAEAAVPALQRLNPRVQISSDSSDIGTKEASFYNNFDVVIVTEASLNTMVLFPSETSQGHKLIWRV